MKIVTPAQMAEIESRSEVAGVSKDVLMENAGLVFAERIRYHMDFFDKSPIVILVGPGNNGKDGLVAARHLSDWGAEVTIALCQDLPETYPHFSPLVERSLSILSPGMEAYIENLDKVLESSVLIVDSILGTGKTRPIEGIMKEILSSLNRIKISKPEILVIALDLPSGLDGDTGQVDPVCPIVDVTVTLGCPKLGEFILPGSDFTGTLEVVSIGIPEGLDGDLSLDLMTDVWARSLVPERPSSAHKGTFGSTLVLAGSKNYVGAAYLASSAAARIGSGLVTLAIPSSLQIAIASLAMEITYIPLQESESGLASPEAAREVIEALPRYESFLVGCGMGRSSKTEELLSRILFTSQKLPPTVIDADGLNWLSSCELNWWEKLTDDMVLTPHPGEMARLTRMSVKDVDSDRIDVARNFASKWQKTVVLKGAHTVVAFPGGMAMVSPFVNPGLATAGTGDVLAGAIAGLLSQGVSPQNAATLGVYLHGLAGEVVRGFMGETGVLASDLLSKFPVVIRDLLYDTA